MWLFPSALLCGQVIGRDELRKDSEAEVTIALTRHGPYFIVCPGSGQQSGLLYN